MPRITSTLAAALLTCAISAHAQPATPQGPGQSMLVLDASGSMWGQIGGKPKIEIAREAVASMLATWPTSQQLGLMVYGHRSKGNCADIEMLKAPGSVDKTSFQQSVNALQPKGMTPISASVRMAAEQLKFSERKATVILVSDGEETCHADPCALGKELEKLGVDFTAHVVGFDIDKNPKAKAELQCLATSTGGKYLDARNAEDLNKAMGDVARTVPAPAPPPAKVASPHFNEGCTAYDQENYTGNRLQIGGAAGGQVREAAERWRKGIKSLYCQPGCSILVFTEPGYDGANFSIPKGAQFPRMPEDYAQPFGSYEVGCSAQTN
jgi:Ca-activated chloride channel family protein